MDGDNSHGLVQLPSSDGTVVSEAVPLVVDDDSRAAEPQAESDWKQIAGLFVFLWALALESLRQLRVQLVDLRLQAHYWQAQHHRAVEREAALKEQVQLLQAEQREWERRCYGRRTETASATSPQPQATAVPKPPPRPRGQQRGSPGHGRRGHEQLPTTHEDCPLPADQQCCPDCGKPLEEIPGTADGDILEIDVRPHRRRYHRRRYRRRCSCINRPAVITAPPPDKLIPKGNIGISLWVEILRRKFEFFTPLDRVLAELGSHGLAVPAGTITDGLKKLEPLFQPLYQRLVEHNRGEGHWHADETRWLVFVKRSDKAGFAWNLWVFAAKESIVFVLDPTRAHKVPEDHFGPDAKGIMNVDRYSAYKAMAQVKSGQMQLSFCWAHVRRDFLAVLTSWPNLTEWAWSWVEAIGELFHRNDQRRTLATEPEACAAADQALRQQVEQIRQRRDRELAQTDLLPPQRKVLTSLQNHWSGLMVFVDHPMVPMDNNEAERRARGPVVGRKNFYGSGSLWSGRLAAMLFSLFQTMQVWNVDVGRWLTAYLTACAKTRGQPPPDVDRYLPWNMTPEQRAQLRFDQSQRARAAPPA